jgi:hypothetical protein
VFFSPDNRPESAKYARIRSIFTLARINARHKREDRLAVFLGAAAGLPERLTHFQVPPLTSFDWPGARCYDLLWKERNGEDRDE